MNEYELINFICGILFFFASFMGGIVIGKRMKLNSIYDIKTIKELNKT